MLGTNVEGYVKAYKAYFDEHAPYAKEPKTMLDPAPRVILDPELGLCTVGRTAKDAAIVEDIYRHTMDIILRATALGGFQASGAMALWGISAPFGALIFQNIKKDLLF